MARLLDSVVGHGEQVQKLTRLKEEGRWPHALLLTGPSGIGKKKIAVAFAQALVCEQSPLACGTCGPCLRIAKMQSESLSLIHPDPELARPVIKVEVIRDLLASLSLSAVSAARVVIIDQASTMNPQAANALLKTLEEPPENVYFMLLANDVHQFLPTIRSRCQVLRFSALSYEQVREIRPGLPDWTYRSCRGQIDRLELLSSEGGAQRREEALGFFDQFCHDPEFLLDRGWRDAVKDRSWVLFSLHCWLLMVRDAAVLKTQAQKFILNTDQADRLKQLYALPSKKLFWLFQKLLAAEKDVNSNADASLVIEDMWVNYARVD